MRFDHPVLIDPITVKVYRVKKICSYEEYDDSMILLMTHMPLPDYPLFLTDASLPEGI